MKPVTLELRERPRQRIDMAHLTPNKLEKLDTDEIAALPLQLGNQLVHVGELFEISGSDPSTVVIANASERLDRIGGAMNQGQIIVEGDAGMYLGQNMRGGTIHVRGDTGPFAGTGLADGEIRIDGNAGDFLGAATPGERQGMRGGVIRVKGNCGDRAGDRQRRGLIMIGGDASDYCGSRMLAGTIVVMGQCGQSVGYGMKRGTILLTKQPASLPVTFNDAGRHNLNFLALLTNKLSTLDSDFAVLGSSEHRVQRFVGDLGWNGQGEVLVLEVGLS